MSKRNRVINNARWIVVICMSAIISAVISELFTYLGFKLPNGILGNVTITLTSFICAFIITNIAFATKKPIVLSK